jgi:hypothetical protein
MAKKKTPPEVFERQKQNILRLRQLLEQRPAEGDRIRAGKVRDEKAG